MGFNPPVPQQDSDWEIRAAVLLSLVLQMFLIFVGPMRKRSSSPVPRFIVWSCYLLADWVADLALGLLLNNMGNIGGGGNNSSSSFSLKRGGGSGTAGNNNANSGGSSSPIIFAFWTPFLLLHLGGPDTITAYSLEDNELWLRHLIGLLFELFSACVIFFCSLHGNPLIHATVLVFVVGIIKYGERTYSLYSGSVDGFRNKILDPPEPGPNYAKLMTEFDSKKKAGLVVEIDIANGEAEQAHEEMEKQETKRLVLDSKKTVEARAYEFFLVFRRLFVNVILSFKERRLSQAFFLEREATTPKEAFEVIEVELNFIYDMVYTKAPLAHKKVGWVLRCICSCCLVSALVIFFFLDKPGHQILLVDVGITYALLLGGLALDVVALLMIFFSNRAKVYLEERSSRLGLVGWLAKLRQATKRWETRRWSGKTSQLNLITHSLGKPAHAWCCLGLNKVADFLGLDDIVDDFVFIRRVWLTKREKNKFCERLRRVVPKCCNKAGVHDMDDDDTESRLLDFIFEGLKGAAQKLDKKHEIMEVCSRRGKGVIDRLEKHIKDGLKDGDDANHNKANKFDLIMESVTIKDFDESLLLWHVATDLCGLRDKDRAETATEARLRPIGETLSEYMLYLLIKQPEMLSATTGIGLLRYRDTCAEARRFFASMDEWVGGDHAAARALLLRVNTSQRPATVKGDRSKSVLFDAVILAKALRALDEDLMWEVVAGDADVRGGQVPGEHARAAAEPRRRAHHPRLVPHGAHGARRHVPDTGRGRQG